jgi:hypothetical protein
MAPALSLLTTESICQEAARRSPEFEELQTQAERIATILKASNHLCSFKNNNRVLAPAF